MRVRRPVGLLSLEAEAGRLTRIGLRAEGPLRPPEAEILATAARQLEEYFAGERGTFTVELLRPLGASDFQHRVWDAMERIPCGETRTYGDLARELGTSPRAVGSACGRNALPILIPCHRVVSASGLGGYAGDWEKGLALEVKSVLLEHERRMGALGSRPRSRR